MISHKRGVSTWADLEVVGMHIPTETQRRVIYLLILGDGQEKECSEPETFAIGDGARQAGPTAPSQYKLIIAILFSTIVPSATR